MSEELSITKEETIENNIVSIVNKTDSKDSENKMTSGETAATSFESAETSEEPAKEQAFTASETVSSTESKNQTAANKANSFDFDEDEEPKKHFFHFRSKNTDYSRDQLILSRIKDDDLMEYLKLEQERLEFLQQAKELKEKRILTAFQLTISLAAIVIVTYLLKDNPTILISILYIVGIIAALNIWKNPRDKDKGKK